MSKVIGKGIFAWDGSERRSDRYGSFTLDKVGYDDNGYCPDASWTLGQSLSSLTGKYVKIKVEIIESRDSGHIGDLSRGIYPTRPEVGEKIILGIGEFFASEENWSASGFSVGVKPSDGRMSDWFEPEKLYRLHDQTVLVTISETKEAELPTKVKLEEKTEDFSASIIFSNDDKGGFYQFKRG